MLHYQSWGGISHQLRTEPCSIREPMYRASLSWIFPWFQYVWSNISAWIPTGISCDIQDIKPRLRWWPLHVEWHVHLRADSAVWLSHTSSIWPWSGAPKSTFIRYICKRLMSSYDHGCHLSKQMGMSPQDYEHLLVAAKLAHFHQKGGFSIKISKWKLFL